MKKSVSLLLVFCLTVFLCACSSNSTVATIDHPPRYAEEKSVPLQYLPDFGDGIFKMTEYNDETWVCRLSEPAWSSIIRTSIDTDDFWENYFLHIVDTKDYVEFSFDSIKKGKDQMIIVGRSGLSCTPIIEMDYTIPYMFSVYDGTIHSKTPVGSAFGGYSEDFEEINGNDPSRYIQRLSSYCNIFQAEKGEKFSFGYFSGTDFVEDEVIADSYYYIVGEDDTYTSLPVTKTKDGYFIIDYSGLTAGYYCFDLGDRATIIKVE